jgi:phosphoglycolate phosphatase-like HAD superfamily hydrolase
MRIIHGILFEPVGCLAEFSAELFNEMATLVSGRRSKTSRSASRTYWYLLNLLETTGTKLSESDTARFEALELEAVETASVYEDVVPALSELQAMDINLVMACSLSKAAVTRFIEKAALHGLFTVVSSRERTEGVKVVPLRNALTMTGLEAEHAMFLTDTADGLQVANNLGLNSILMMNDPDEAMRLADHGPSGGIVSFHELPDFIRLVAAENARRP